MRKRLPILVVILAVAIVAVSLSGRGAVTRSGYQDQSGWWVSYPRSLQVEASVGPLSADEFTVASFGASAGLVSRSWPGGGSVTFDPPLDRQGRFPSDGVAFRVESVGDSAPALSFGGRSTKLPISLDSLRASRVPSTLAFNAATAETATSRYGDAPRSVVRTLIEDGKRFFAVAWIGSRATLSARRRLASVVDSLVYDGPVPPPPALLHP